MEPVCQFVGCRKVCDRNAGWVSKNDKSFHSCSMKLKGEIVQYEKYVEQTIHFFKTEMKRSNLWNQVKIKFL